MKSKKFNLKISDILQGDFKAGELNLLLVFQVNCPGCFVYAFPVANKIVQNYSSKGLKVMGLSTAFEDFEYNNLENTKLLLKDGTIVGETKKALGSAGHATLPFKINFDVAFDHLEPQDSRFIEENIDEFCRTLPSFEEKNDVEKKLIRAQVKEYLMHKKMKAMTFDSNYLMGTPSWVLFDKDYNVIFDFFGEKKYEDFERILDQILENPK